MKSPFGIASFFIAKFININYFEFVYKQGKHLDNTSPHITFTEHQLLNLSIVQAVEETGNVLSEAVVAEANISALHTENDTDFLIKRTNYLYQKLPSIIKNWSKFALLPKDWLGTILLLTFITGLLSNYLGTEKSIHVIYNPITILIIWNLFVYILYILKGIKAVKLRFPKLGLKFNVTTDDSEKPLKSRKKPYFFQKIFLDGLLGGLYRRSFTFHLHHDQEIIDLNTFKESLIRFWFILRKKSATHLISRFNSLLNAGAVGIVLGALVGTYIRGVFFKYNVVWESTFLTDTGLITAVINILYGPASLLFDGKLISPETIQTLSTVEGISAASWIHKLSLTVVLMVLVPRTIFSVLFALRAGKSKTAIVREQPYLQQILLHTREHMINTIHNGIENILLKRIKLLAENLAGFVQEDYFDKYIATRLLSFKNNGGKIADLESALSEYQEQFKPVLSENLEKEQNEFREIVQQDIESLIGREFNVKLENLNKTQTHDMKLDHELTGQMARDIGDTVGTTVTAAVAAAVATVSGGIGHTLGIAIVSSVLGVSGPIGLLIGGIGAGVAMGSAYKLLRKKVTDSVKKIHLPAIVVSKTLSDKKIDKARSETYTSIKTETIKMLEPQIKELTETILKNLTENFKT